MSLVSSAAKSNSATLPATLGSSARRRGRDAARHRSATTTATATEARPASERWPLSTASAMPAFGKAASRLPSCS